MEEKTKAITEIESDNKLYRFVFEIETDIKKEKLIALIVKPDSIMSDKLNLRYRILLEGDYVPDENEPTKKRLSCFWRAYRQDSKGENEVLLNNNKNFELVMNNILEDYKLWYKNKVKDYLDLSMLDDIGNYIRKFEAKK